ncbi:MAG: amino acid adenylation domain-containing protein, partial [Acutalibacteraceae bacterium]|nr:amino acid adenylation domain-containing protein [Acutalibacteraceae bacterium]
LSETLPEYMIPSYMMQIEVIPITKNGKLDKRALPDIESKTTREYIAPRTESEKVICEIFREILGAEKVGINDGFFELGGHSLRATRLVNSIEVKLGAKVALKDVFLNTTPEQLAKIVDDSTDEEYVSIPKAEEKEYYPMSSAQRRTYLIQQMEPEAVTYNMSQSIKLKGEVYPEKLRSALQEMTDRHEILRTVFLTVDGECVQKILPKVEADFEYVLESTQSDEEMYNKFVRPFDLSKAQNVRIKLVNRNEYHLLLIDMHHIVSDGMSENTFTEELIALYNGEKLEPLTHQFKDYSEWMRTRDLSSQKEYWVNEFSDEIPVLDMPLDYTRPQMQSYNGASVNKVIDEEVSKSLNELSQKTGATPYMIFLSALMIMLGKYSRQEDIVVGSPISGRTHKDTEKMLGMFVNTLAMRGRPEGDKKYSDFLEEIKISCLKAYENQEYPFEELVENVDVNRDMSRSPLFDVMLVMQNNEETNGELSNIEMSDASSNSNIAKFDLDFTVLESDKKFAITLDYCTDLYKKETAEKLLKHYELLLKNLILSTDSKIKEFEMITAEEKDLIFSFNATEKSYPSEKTVVEMFEEQVEKTPENTAVIFEGKSITYKELNERANVIAHKLRAVGVKPDDLVAIIAERSIEMIIGIYGIIKAGGAYVPIDPTYPKERVEYITKDCSTKAVLVYSSENDIDVSELQESVTVINLADESSYIDGNAENPERVNTPNDLIYCIYTSGTTGQPKGVMNRHTGLINRIMWMHDRYPLSETGKILQKTTYTFDVSVWEIIWWSLVGASVVMLVPGGEKDPEIISRTIIDNEITTLHFVPSMLNMFLAYLEDNQNIADEMVSIEHIFASGEALPKETVHKMYEILGKHKNLLLSNFYGPTEASIDVTYFDCSADDKIVPIGKPIYNTGIYILDGLKLCGVGVPGELCIAGTGLARGYLNKPELTAEKFIDNPYAEGKLYRSGDLARWMPDGNIEYLGRIDEQVKIRGFRIELGEIESRIKKIEEIKDSAVIVRSDKGGDKAIYAYYTSDVEVNAIDIRKKLSENLPEYMVPSYMMQIEAIPVTKNGKLDKRALPEIESRTTREYVAPRTESEKVICEIFGEILAVEKVGINDGFFELGGHSLRATRLVNNIEARLGVKIALKDVFSHTTPEQLARIADGSTGEEYVPIPKAEEKEYYPMSSAQKRTYLIQQMDPDAITYNMPQSMKLEGEVYPEKLKSALQKMTDRHEILRTSFLTIDGECLQKILPSIEADFEYVSESTKSDEEIYNEFVRPFDLDNGQTVRIKLVNKGEYHLLLIDMHHIVSDGMSVATFTEEFIALYNDQHLEPLTHQFKDYSEWMRTRDLSSQKEYWVNEFSDEIPVLDMPLDYTRPQIQSSKGSNIQKVIDKSITDSINALSQKTGATPYMIFLSAMMIMLSKYSRQEDIVVGSPISGRTHKDTEKMLGMFVNTLAMRGKPEGNKKYSDFLEEIKSSCLKAYENQEYPFEELVENVDVNRDMSRNPLFDAFLVLQNNEQVDKKLSETEISEIDEVTTISKFDIEISIAPYNDSYMIILGYCSDLYKRDTAQRMLEHYEVLLNKLTMSYESKINEVEMITEEERNIVCNEFNDTYVDYPNNFTMIEMFEAQVERTPDNIAVVYEDDSITYRELNNRAEILARKIAEYDVKPDTFVALISERGINMIVGIIGAMKSGAAYIPINPSTPNERIQYMLKDSKPKVVLTYKAHIETDIPVLDISDIDSWEVDETLEIEPSKPENLIYCIYTSGTTGNPKAVMVEHRNVLSDFYQFINKFSISDKTVSLQQASFAFDMFVEEFYPTICSGGKVVIVPVDMVPDVERLCDYIDKNKATLVHVSPLLVSEINRSYKLDSVKTYIIGSDKLKYEYIDNILKTDTAVWNAYGPTETTVIETALCIKGYGKDSPVYNNCVSIPIGKPIDNSAVYILNGNELCGIGIPGELCITGLGVVRGYMNNPELTAEKFVDNPFGEGRMYRTGDLAKWLPDGNIDFMGRIDDQIKIRGFRIELGEIEHRIKEISEVDDCAVLARADKSGEKAIYAYYTATREIEVSEVRDKLSETLPEYMIPPYMMQIEAMPINRNGKLDRRALPDIVSMAIKDYVEPTTEIEKLICKSFSEILGIEKIGINDSFFELGGDSIKAIRIISKLRNAGYNVTVKDIMGGKTVEKIASLAKINSEIQMYEQGEVTGKVENTPIIESFAKSNYAKAEHYNQAMMFNVSHIENDIINMAIKELIKHHDILRAVYKNGELEIRSFADSRELDFYEFDYSGYENPYDAIEQKCTEIQGSIDLENGLLIKAAVFKVYAEKVMMICVHHLAVDAVSWHIISEDFETVIEQLENGKDIKLPDKTASFVEWSKKLKEYGENIPKSEKDYWNKIADLQSGQLKSDDVSDNNEMSESSIELSEEVTRKLLDNYANVSNAKIDEVLLSSLAMAVRKLTGQDKLTVSLEGHGREDALELSVDRTVGWFTCIYPVVLECSDDIKENIISTKEIMRGVEAHRLSYAYAKNEQDSFTGDICFNYLSEFSTDKESLTDKYSAGTSIAVENNIGKEISVDGGVLDGKLMFGISSIRFTQEFINRLADEFTKAIVNLAEYCADNSIDEKTASDYGVYDMTVKEFRLMQSELKGSVDKIYGLTPLQEGMLFYNLQSEQTTSYVLQEVFKISMSMNIENIQKALALLSYRYEVLKTAFISKNVVNPKQVVYTERIPEFECIDANANEVATIVHNDLVRGFDLENDTLLRVKLIRLGENECKIIWTMHHIITDGWCLQLLFNKFMEYYVSLEKSTFEEIKHNIESEKAEQGEFSEYIGWLEKQNPEKATQYWKNLLAGYENTTEVKPMLIPEPCESQMNRVVVSMTTDVTENLIKLAELNDTTISNTLETACGIMLHRYIGSNDAVFGKVVSGRNAEINDIDNIVGLFINTIPVRVNAEEEITVSELLKKQQKQSNASSDYDYCSLADIQSLTQQGADLIKVIYVFENYNSGLNTQEGSENELQQAVSAEESREQTTYPISISGYIEDGQLCVAVMYNPNEYCENEINIMLAHLEKICEEMSLYPDKPVNKLDSITQYEKDLIFGSFNDTLAEYPKDKTVVDLFEEQVAKTPDKIAVVIENESITFKELDEKANILAGKLRKLDIHTDEFVSVITERSIEMIIAIIGVIKSGAAYIPINPNTPDERIQYMLNDSSSKAVLVYKANIETEIPVLDLSEDNFWDDKCFDNSETAGTNNLIYCIYTSGTTGKPKAVMVEHRNVVADIAQFTRRFSIDSEVRSLQQASFAFDMFVEEFYPAICNGGTVYIAPADMVPDAERLCDYINNNKITLVHISPLLINEVNRLNNISTVKTLIVGSDKLKLDYISNIIKGETEIWNGYGPTETTVVETSFLIKERGKNGKVHNNYTAVPIGKPVDNSAVYILNGDKLCGIGIPGELCITGDGVTRGYLNMPELTAEKFVDNPFGEGKMYRSGDLAKWLPDGNIGFLGRIDDQVKIRGYRIELQEIEKHFKKIDGVIDAAVIARENSNGEKSLYAYYVAEYEVESVVVSKELAKYVPAYMIPPYMMQIDAMPMNRNGKLDRSALPVITVRTEKEYIEPRTKTEKIVCNMFAEILGAEKVGATDNFFDLGGHSLRATRLVNSLQVETGVRIALKDVFANPTVEQLAEIIDNNQSGDEYESIPKAAEKEYYPMSSSQKRTYLIQQMQPETVTYNMPNNITLTGNVEPEYVKSILQQMIQRHEILRTQFLMIDGEPVQKILESKEADFEYEEYSDKTDEELVESFIKPFNLEKAQLVRIKLVKRDGYYLMIVDMHHIVGDGMSMNTFIREFTALYNKETLEPLTHQFKDYSEWMNSRDLSNQEEYWVNEFSDEIPVLDMPLDYTRPQEQSYDGEMITSVTGSELSKKIKSLATSTGATEYMVFLAAAMVTIAKYSRQDDVVIGSPISGRTHRDTETMLGMFVNTLAMRGKPEGEKRFIDFLDEVKAKCLKAYENQEYPFEELVENVNVNRDLSRNPIFDVMLVLQNNENEEINLNDSELSSIEYQSSVSKFDLTFNIEQEKNNFTIILEYCTALFKRESSKLLLKHYIEVLNNITNNPEAKINEISMVTAEEEQKVTIEFNATELEYSKGKTIAEMFEEQVEKTPENIAVVYGEEKLTYRELNEKANALAYKLRE